MIVTFDEQQFRTNVIALIKSVYPDLVVVARNQNVTQPVDISAGERMMDIEVESVVQLGTDYVYTEDGTSVYYAGDRIVQVSLELFAPDATTMMENMRSLWRTIVFYDKMRRLKITHIHGGDVYNTTRVHGETQYVTSVEYVTKFQAITEYMIDIDELSYIDSTEIEGQILN
jgi:hypothetical protein